MTEEITKVVKMTLYSSLTKSHRIPWRLRSRVELWTETFCYEQMPALYRWLHFGNTKNIIRHVTTGPNHHFFGYYDKSPWNTSSTLLAAHQVAFNDRPPEARDKATIGVVRLKDNNRFQPVGVTHAWNWQQGAMLQWHPIDPENWLIYNDRQEGHPVSVVCDTNGSVIRTYQRPVYATTPDGQSAYSLNFARLANHRPGYGYAGITDTVGDELTPADDGVWLLSLDSGASRLLVSLKDLAELQTLGSMKDSHHWINHIQVSPTGSRFAFFHLWRTGDIGWSGRLYVADHHGQNLTLVLDSGMISHYDWLDEEHILIWARVPHIGDRFILCNVHDDTRQIIGKDVLTEDGHCSFSPDRNWVLNDTYPDRFDKRTLMLYRWRDGLRIDLARLYSPKSKWWGEIRCDLHPRWSRDGRMVCLDSVHSGLRQVYVADVSEYVD